jgi:hypothetical protein
MVIPLVCFTQTNSSRLQLDGNQSEVGHCHFADLVFDRFRPVAMNSIFGFHYLTVKSQNRLDSLPCSMLIR